MGQKNCNLNMQLYSVKADLEVLLEKLETAVMNIEKNDRVTIEEQIFGESAVKTILEAKNLQGDLAMLQAKLANYLDHLEKKIFHVAKLQEAKKRTSRELVPGGIKLTILNEYPPKSSIYDRITFRKGKITNQAYAEARNRWYSLIRTAMEGYEGERIAPAIVHIKYHVRKVAIPEIFSANSSWTA